MSSIRWKILLAFLLIVGISFVIMLSSLTGLVSNYLFTQRTRQDSLSVEKLATTLAPLFESASSDSLNEELASSAGEMGGRLLVVDASGKVQYDSFSLLFGSRLELPEVISVLANGESTAYGIHTIESDDAMNTTDSATHVSYCAAKLPGTGGTDTIGALVFVSPVEELITSLSSVERQMTTVFAVVAAAALMVALIFSRVLTKPIVGLTATLQKMGHGDLSVRVPVKGSGELREMAISYNTMAEQLESLDKSRNQFVSNASHELKTPLTTMKILLESLIYQPDMPQELRTEFMQDMDHEIDRLSGIVTDLLTLTRMDDHKMELHLADTDISQLTEENLRLLMPMAEKRKQTLHADIVPGIMAEVDSAKMSQVFYNLIENALKYTPDGGEVTVSLVRDGENLLWRVRDNGVGIPEEDLPHIFERFYRVDKARSRDTGGTGLGLSIVKQITALHGGEITVKSTLGQGSIFTLTLPMKEDAHS